MRFADSHCHLTDRAFRADRAAVLARAREAGVVRVVTIASDAEDSLAALELARANDDVWCTAGIHPHAVNGAAAASTLDAASRPGTASTMDAVRDVAAHPRCVAIGETGLDYFYDNAPRDAQRRSFARHVELAAELDLPVVVHSREAEADTAAVVRESAGQVRGVLHCFTGSRELLAEAMAAGWFVSFTGIATFKNFDADLVRDALADRYMIETDAPYLAPVPKRGRRNEPAFVAHVAAAVARLRGETPERVAEDTWANTASFFRIPEEPS
ncbi:MAG: TatD family hydrolase [Gemmatimonadota bacterium]|nr:TatD family hydrolase [Gemmatimonadota bacterium]